MSDKAVIVIPSETDKRWTPYYYLCSAHDFLEPLMAEAGGMEVHDLRAKILALCAANNVAYSIAGSTTAAGTPAKPAATAPVPPARVPDADREDPMPYGFVRAMMTELGVPDHGPDELVAIAKHITTIDAPRQPTE